MTSESDGKPADIPLKSIPFAWVAGQIIRILATYSWGKKLNNRSHHGQILRFFFVLSFTLIQGCSSTPIVHETYGKEETNRGGAGFGVLVRFNPVGERHESCSIGDSCWIFGSPYDVYFEVSSPEMKTEKLCFEGVEFRVGSEILYSDDLEYCAGFQFDKLDKDYRVYKRIPMVELGFNEGREVIVTLTTRFNGQIYEYILTVRPVKIGESSSDLFRHIYSI